LYYVDAPKLEMLYQNTHHCFGLFTPELLETVTRHIFHCMHNSQCLIGEADWGDCHVDGDPPPKVVQSCVTFWVALLYEFYNLCEKQRSLAACDK
jgi:hypothetical protein